MAISTQERMSSVRAARLARFDQVHQTVVPAKAHEPVVAPSTKTSPPAEERRTTRLERVAHTAARAGVPHVAPNDDEEELAAAIALSLQQEVLHTPPRLEAQRPEATPFWSPPRYTPAARSEGDRLLNLMERAQVRDGGYEWQSCTALLDTGNAGLTVVDERFAARHAIYRQGQPAERFVTLRGVVPGVMSRAPVVTIALKIRGHDLIVPAAISTLSNEDVLVSMDCINQLFAAGFRLGAGSA